MLKWGGGGVLISNSLCFLGFHPGLVQIAHLSCKSRSLEIYSGCLMTFSVTYGLFCTVQFLF